ncbi:hypothetical protein ACVBEE_16540 [Acinetobacter sp. ANC 3781]
MHNVKQLYSAAYPPEVITQHPNYTIIISYLTYVNYLSGICPLMAVQTYTRFYHIRAIAELHNVKQLYSAAYPPEVITQHPNYTIIISYLTYVNYLSGICPLMTVQTYTRFYHIRAIAELHNVKQLYSAAYPPEVITQHPNYTIIISYLTYVNYLSGICPLMAVQTYTRFYHIRAIAELHNVKQLYSAAYPPEVITQHPNYTIIISYLTYVNYLSGICPLMAV